MLCAADCVADSVAAVDRNGESDCAVCGETGTSGHDKAAAKSKTGAKRMAGIKIVAGQFGDEGNDWVRRLKQNYAGDESGGTST